MYAYIICFCGRAIGDINDAFEAMRSELYKEKGVDIDPSQLGITEFVTVELAPVFEQLGVSLPCCKTRLMTQIKYSDIY